MALRRDIGKWALTGLMVNATIGSGIFGVPGELLKLLGPASPFAFCLAGLGMSLIVACYVEVSSQFTEAGGSYLYVRTAFGRWAGLQIAWFSALAPIAACAAQANLFAAYLAEFNEAAATGAGRVLVMCVLIGVPTGVNLVGANAGKALSSVLVIAKLLPLCLLIGMGLLHGDHPGAVRPDALKPDTHSALSAWLTAILLTTFSYGGFEDSLSAAGEFKRPRQTVVFGLVASLVICSVVYFLTQLTVVHALGDMETTRPLAAVGAVLLGPLGASFITVTALISTAGAISSNIMATPRIVFALADRNDFPATFARVNAAGSAPVAAVLAVGVLVLLLAVTGTFKWALAITAGSQMIVLGSACAALVRLRSLHPAAAAVRLPAGRTIAVLGVLFSVLLVAQLQPNEIELMSVVVSIGLVHGLLLRALGSPPTRPLSRLSGSPAIPPASGPASGSSRGSFPR